MTTLMRNRMRRHTRPAKFVSRYHQAESMAWSRPGSNSFSFSGEFPTMGDQQPVEITCSRRVYTASRTTGCYRAVGNEDTSRMPAINRHGVHYATGLAMLAALVLILGGVFWGRLEARSQILDAMTEGRSAYAKLEKDCVDTQNDIDARANDVSIRKEALRLGMISSKGVAVEYLSVPMDAVITQKDQTAIQALASIWGQ